MVHTCGGATKDDIMKRKCHETRHKISCKQNITCFKIKEHALDLDREMILQHCNSDLPPEKHETEIPVNFNQLLGSQRSINRSINYSKFRILTNTVLFTSLATYVADSLCRL